MSGGPLVPPKQRFRTAIAVAAMSPIGSIQRCTVVSAVVTVRFQVKLTLMGIPLTTDTIWPQSGSCIHTSEEQLLFARLCCGLWSKDTVLSIETLGLNRPCPRQCRVPSGLSLESFWGALMSCSTSQPSLNGFCYLLASIENMRRTQVLTEFDSMKSCELVMLLGSHAVSVDRPLPPSPAFPPKSIKCCRKSDR